MEEEKIKVLALLPMELPKEIELDNTLEAMQNFVGGLIECITYIDCGAITLRDQSLFFNCGYVVPPLNAQYEVVQPDLHSLERYDFSKEPDLPWCP